MDNRNIPNQPPWPEDFDVALKSRQKALENKPPARCLWRQRLVLVAKVLAIGVFIFVLFILVFSKRQRLTIASTIRSLLKNSASAQPKHRWVVLPVCEDRTRSRMRCSVT
jgi:hypothetical protein